MKVVKKSFCTRRVDGTVDNKIVLAYRPEHTVHRQTSERQTSERTNVRSDKRQKGQTSEATNVRNDKRQKGQTSERQTSEKRRKKRQKNVGKS